jgi:hypothetical protein
VSAGEDRWVEIRYTKWPDKPHYAYRMRRLGEDQHGVWGRCDVGEEVYKADQLAFVREVALLSLVPRVGCWSALWYPPEEKKYEVYVDINSDPSWSPSSVSMIDLDFDVERKRNGEVSLVDEDEFEENRVRFEYPNDLVDFARTAARDVTAAVEAPLEPFASHWRVWYARCFSEG